MNGIVFKVCHGTGDWYEVAKCPQFPKGHRVENPGLRNGPYGLGELLRQLHGAAKGQAYRLELRLGGTTIFYDSPALGDVPTWGSLQDFGRANRPGGG